MFGGWQLRWFELKDGCFRYWESPAYAKLGRPAKGEVNCRGLTVSDKSGSKFCVKTSQTSDRAFSLDANCQSQVAAAKWDIGPSPLPSMQDWVRAFEQEGVVSRAS